MSLAVSQNGMQTFRHNIDQTSNNLANLQTPGFQALVSEQQSVANQSGSVSSPTSLKSTPGPIKNTERPLDLNLNGNKYFQVQTDSGRGFVRSGQFTVDKQGSIIHAATGRRLLGDQGPIQIDNPELMQNVSVKQDGRVVATFPDGPREAGQIQPVRFQNPSGLRRDDGLLRESANSGEPTPTESDQQNGVRSGQLEMSNVSTTNEILSLQRNLRFFQLNNRAFRVRDQMLQRANTLV